MFCKAYWATPFKMHFDFRSLFRRTLAELWQNFRENTPIRRPQPSAGGTSEEKQTPGALVFGPRKALLLEAWLLHLEGFLRLQKATLGSTSGNCKDVLQEHGIWLTFGSLAVTYGAVPFSCRTPGGRRW